MRNKLDIAIALLVGVLVATACTARADWRRGLVLDGSSEYTEFDSSAIDFTTSDFTLSCWVNPTTLAGDPMVIGNGRYQNYGYYVEIRAALTDVIFATQRSGDSDQIDSSAGSMAANEWTHIAVTKEGTTGTIYINGVADGSGTLANPTTSPQPLRLGAYWDLSLKLSGSITHILGWNRALSSKDIEGLCDLNTANTNVGVRVEVPRALINGANTLVLDLDMPEVYDTGETVAEVKDASPSGNDGTLEPTQATGPQWSGERGGSYDFDGAGYIATANSLTDINFETAFSACFWVLMDAVPSQSAWVGKYDTGGNKRSWLVSSVLDSGDRMIQVAFGDPSDGTFEGTWNTSESGLLYPIGSWFHVGITYDAGTVIVYLNGIEEAGFSAGTIPTSLYNTTDSVRMGAVYVSGSPSVFLDGKMDEVFLTPDVLSSNEVYGIAVNDILPADNRLLLYPFDYASDRMLNNGSAGGTATITGTPDTSGAFQVPSPHR